MQKLVRLIIGAALIALGIWAWRALFPSPERVIRSRVLSLAKTFSYDRNEGAIAKAYNTTKLLDYFTLDVEIFVEPRGSGPQTISGRDEVMRAAAGVRSYFRELKVKFPDVNVTVNADKVTAVANVTATISGLGDQDWIQEMNLLFKLVDKRWLIYRVETVKTLTLRQRPVIHGMEPRLQAVHQPNERRAKLLTHFCLAKDLPAEAGTPNPPCHFSPAFPGSAML